MLHSSDSVDGCLKVAFVTSQSTELQLASFLDRSDTDCLRRTKIANEVLALALSGRAEQ
jgi:hypothetical protein